MCQGLLHFLYTGEKWMCGVTDISAIYRLESKRSFKNVEEVKYLLMTVTSTLHSWGNYEQTKFRYCLPPSSSESYVFHLLFYLKTKIKIYKTKFTHCFVWVWNLVCNSKDWECLVLSGMKWQKAGENCTMRISIIILFTKCCDYQIKRDVGRHRKITKDLPCYIFYKLWKMHRHTSGISILYSVGPSCLYLWGMWKLMYVVAKRRKCVYCPKWKYWPSSPLLLWSLHADFL